MSTDYLRKFILEQGLLSGGYINLESTWQRVLQHRDYPVTVRTLLGELVAACALLTASLKFEGTLTLQIYGDGPVRLAVVECSSDLKIRAMAQYSGIIPDYANLNDLINLKGQGQFVLILSTKSGEILQQSIVPLENIDNAQKNSIPDTARILSEYMQKSEQIDTHFLLANNTQQVIGLILRRLPDLPQANRALTEETWQTTQQLCNTLRTEELLCLSEYDLLKRLFWKEDIRLFPPQKAEFYCSCSDQKVNNLLTTLGKQQADLLLQEQQVIEINCRFCTKRYAFKPEDISQIFVENKTLH